MDINSRDEAYEQNEKRFKTLKENYLKKYINKEVINESLIDKKRSELVKTLAKNGINKSVNDINGIDEAEQSEAPIEPTPNGSDVATDTPVDGSTEPTPTATPEEGPESSTSGKALEDNQDQVLKTQEFANATVAKGLETIGGGFNAETDVLPSGVLKKEVQDPQLGNYTILVFPSEFKAADVVATAYPTPDGADMADAEADVEGSTEPAPEVGTDETPAPTGEVPPVESAPEEEKLQEEENEEQKLEESRDPTVVGKKDWKKMLQKRLNESLKKVMNEETEDDLNKKIKNLEEKIKNSSGEEKEAAEEALEAVKSRKAKMKGKEAADKTKQGALSDKDKEKVKDTEE